ncbi:FMN-binding glutamate synthase family protein [Paenisporosarcina antarctica]|uniref:FMN-binding glutamate synthase family protein n=1 Tax=Paenisporosarcina antarctica TaxID=417367 RepID=A0A4V1ANE0_9BACL|nr:FMN-binding glutamate synthase family protein [Paenisporosarcina antarctica]QBP42445.1 FMN-binding glutamate synthase family protein [Paenisporosarcina antarctica]
MYVFIIGLLAGIIISLVLVLVFVRPLIKWVFGYITKLIMTESYEENIWEVVTASRRFHPITNVENSLRAESGKTIERPFGTARKFLNFDGLIFTPAQLATLPTSETIYIDTKIVIGPCAKKPLRLDIPILLGAMGYGVGVSEKVRIAMAKGTAAVGTATNTGKGGFLPEDRKNAKYLIIQYGKAKWSKEPEILKQGDAIEIHIGQGAEASAPYEISPEKLKGKSRGIMGLNPSENAVIPSRHKEINHKDDLKPLVKHLREVTGGVPIGVKICAGNKLEEDMESCINAEVDFISIDGGQAGTHGSAPILEDDFGLPTIYALSRAIQYLEKRKVKDKISLLVGGGFFTPGDCFKALALGANAVYMGTAPLWAMNHTQLLKTMPFEPPTQLTFDSGKLKDKFDEEEGAKSLEKFFLSFVDEMKTAVQSLGKTSITEVNTEDLVAIDELTSHITKIPLAYQHNQKTNNRRF